MAKKLRSYRLLSCILAVLTTFVFIISCGEGIEVEIDKIKMQTTMGHFEDRYSEVVENSKSSGMVIDESSSSAGSGGDEDSSSSEELPFSSFEEPSSASLPSSSSEEYSSSGESPYTLECNILPANSTFPPGVKIPKEKRPELKCKEKANGASTTLDNDNDVGKWTNQPIWNGPEAGTYNNIMVKVERDDKGPCHGLEVKCNGTITVTAPSSSSTPPPPPPPPPPSSSSQSHTTTPSSSSRSSSSSSASSGGGACGSDSRGDNCLWNGAGDCWPIKNADDRANCGKNAWIYQGGTTGEGTACKGGTFVCGKDSSPPSGGKTSLGCCHWETETKCWDVYEEKEKTDCSGGNNKFSSTKCPDKEGTCPSGIR